MPFFNTQKTGEVEPLKKRFHDLKPVATKQFKILIKPVRDQNVFERLTFAQDFLFCVSVVSLEIIIKVYEKPIHIRVVRQDFVCHDQNPTVF